MTAPSLKKRSLRPDWDMHNSSTQEEMHLLTKWEIFWPAFIDRKKQGKTAGEQAVSNENEDDLTPTLLITHSTRQTSALKSLQQTVAQQWKAEKMNRSWRSAAPFWGNLLYNKTRLEKAIPSWEPQVTVFLMYRLPLNTCKTDWTSQGTWSKQMKPAVRTPPCSKKKRSTKAGHHRKQLRNGSLFKSVKKKSSANRV